MNKLDSQVQQLINLVQKKKSQIQKAEKPNWITTCSITLDDGKRINIQTITDLCALVNILAFLMAKEQAFNSAATELGLNVPFHWQGYSVNDWKSDIQTRVSKIQIAQNRAELDEFEKRLDKLVSPERKRELELADIASKLLKD